MTQGSLKFELAARHRHRSAQPQPDLLVQGGAGPRRQVVQLQNEKLAEICAAQPDGFVGLASAALQHPDLAADQLEHAGKQLGLRGALVGGSFNGEELSDPKFHPFWAKAEELGVLMFIPQGTAELNTSSRLKGNGVLENLIGNQLETTIALSHLMFERTLDACPG
jgi:aminocarboxymuconate-semialdehyde decarboxylase